MNEYLLGTGYMRYRIVVRFSAPSEPGKMVAAVRNVINEMRWERNYYCAAGHPQKKEVNFYFVPFSTLIVRLASEDG